VLSQVDDGAAEPAAGDAQQVAGGVDPHGRLTGARGGAQVRHVLGDDRRVESGTARRVDRHRQVHARWLAGRRGEGPDDTAQVLIGVMSALFGSRKAIRIGASLSADCGVSLIDKRSISAPRPMLIGTPDVEMGRVADRPRQDSAGYVP
jgi:hypothetical protein